MIYEYNCEKCGSQDVMKPASESSREEFCSDCGLKMARVYSLNTIISYGDYFDRMSDSERWGYAKHKQVLEKQMKEKKAQGIEVERIDTPKGTPKEFTPEVPR
jgi:putative FmdB family regulatory protein